MRLRSNSGCREIHHYRGTSAITLHCECAGKIARRRGIHGNRKVASLPGGDGHRHRHARCRELCVRKSGLRNVQGATTGIGDRNGLRTRFADRDFAEINRSWRDLERSGCGTLRLLRRGTRGQTCTTINQEKKGSETQKSSKSVFEVFLVLFSTESVGPSTYGLRPTVHDHSHPPVRYRNESRYWVVTTTLVKGPILGQWHTLAR